MSYQVELQHNGHLWDQTIDNHFALGQVVLSGSVPFDNGVNTSDSVPRTERFTPTGWYELHVFQLVSFFFFFFFFLTVH